MNTFCGVFFIKKGRQQSKVAQSLCSSIEAQSQHSKDSLLAEGPDHEETWSCEEDRTSVLCVSRSQVRLELFPDYLFVIVWLCALHFALPFPPKAWTD